MVVVMARGDMLALTAYIHTCLEACLMILTTYMT